MSDTQLPKLPDPEGYADPAYGAFAAFTADQMRAYALQSRAQLAQGEPTHQSGDTTEMVQPDQVQPVDVSDEDAIFDDWLKASCLTYYPDADIIEPDKFTHLCKDDIIQLIRVASALRPAAQTERESNATARAFSLATMAAEEFVRCNGLSTGEADEFLMTGADLTDEYATACIEHLKHVGECVAFDCDDGVIVRLGDFTLGSLS